MAGVGATLSTLPRAAILHAAESARLQRLVQQHGKRVGAARFVAGETLDECVGVLRKLNDAGLHANTTLLGEAIPDVEGADGHNRRVRTDSRTARRREAEGEHRAQAHTSRPRVRRGGRVCQRRAARRPGRRARHVPPHRHGAVRLRRGDAPSVRAPPRCRTRQRRHRAAVVPLPHARRPRTAPAARSEPQDREGRVPRARLDRVPGEARRRPCVSRARAARPARGRVHRGRDARRVDHQTGAGVRSTRRHPARSLRVPDALRRAARPPALDRSRGLQGARRRHRSAPIGTRTSCAASRSGRRTSGSS